MLKVALITNIPSPYRQDLFSKLHKIDNVNFCIYYCSVTEETRQWEVSFGDYNYKVLKGKSFKDVYHFNPSIVKELLKEKYDLVICAGYSYPTLQLSYIISLLSKTPMALWSESTLMDYNQNGNSLRKNFKKAFLKYVFQGFKAFVVPGISAEQYVLHYGASKKQVFIAPTTCDIDYFYRKSRLSLMDKKVLKEKLKINTKKIIVAVGRLIEVKGIDYLIKACAEIEDTTLLLIGDGPEKQNYKSLCEKYQVEHKFVGFVDIDTLPLYYAISDVLAFPSLGDVWGLVVNEAMACGLPVITTDKVGCAKDLIREGVNGYVVKAGDVAELNEKLDVILSLDTAQKMGNNSLEIIKEYSNDNSVQGFEKLINYIKGNDSSENSY